MRPGATPTTHARTSERARILAVLAPLVQRQGKVRDLPHLQKTHRVSHIPRHP
jgi:hypothetical protein